MQFPMCVPGGLVMILVGLPGSMIAAETPSAEELLTVYEQSTQRLAPFHLELTAKHYVKDGEPGVERLGGRVHVIIHHKADLWKVWTDQSAIRRDGNILREHRGLREDIVNRNHLTVKFTHRSQYPLDLSASLDPHLDGQQIRKFLSDGALILGYVESENRPLWQILRESGELTVLPEPELIGGIETHVLKGDTPDGEYTLWLDLHAGALPRQIEIHKTADMLRRRAAETLRRQQTPAPGGRRRRRKVPSPRRWASELRIRIENIRIENRESRFVITAFDRVPVADYETGPESNRRSEVRVQHVDFSPETWPGKTFTPTIFIPDGTRVSVDEGYHIWSRDHIEQVAHPVYKKRIGQKLEAETGSRTRLILLLAGNALLAAGAVYWFIRSRNGKQPR